jgi:hypothetical protein
MPILSSMGGLAARAFGMFSAPQSSFESIATALPTTGPTSVTFSSIPQGYKHLQIRVTARVSLTEINLLLKFNGDATATWVGHYLQTDGTTTTSASLSVPTSVPFFTRVANSSASPNIYGVGITDILEYNNTNKYKTVRGMSGYDTNGSGYAVFTSNMWMNTAAITSIEVSIAGGSVFTTGSVVALYGIKG